MKAHVLMLAAGSLLVACTVPTGDGDDDQADDWTTTTTTAQGAGGGSTASTSAGVGGGTTGSGPSGSTDLGEIDFRLWRAASDPVWSTQTSSYHTTITVCINNGGDYGNFVSARNLGTSAIERPFELAIGVWNDNQATYTLASQRLTSDIYIAPGDFVEWTGPICVSIPIEHTQTDDVRLFVFADSELELDETNEDNNVVIANEAIPLF